MVDPIPGLMQANNRFAEDLFGEFLKTPSNLVFSPFSIFTALSMVYIGGDQETGAQIKKMLRLQLHQHDLPDAFSAFFQTKHDKRLIMANALWADLGTYFSPEYLKLITQNFQGEAAIVDFNQKRQAAFTINDWTKNQTDGKIPSLIAPSDLGNTTRLVLTSGVTFKGQWRFPFQPKRSSDAPFYIADNHIALVPTMHRMGAFNYFDDGIFEILSLPFETGDEKDAHIVLLIFLPHKVDELRITEEIYSKALKNLSLHTVSISLPKFTLRERFNLNAFLNKRGMSIAFTEKANFSKIDGLHDLFLSQVIHEAYLNLDEQGIEATAAAAVETKDTAIPPQEQPIVFNANHPFIFALANLDSGTLLFLGKLIDPKGRGSQ